MTKNIIESEKWQEYLGDFSERNQGRRARFEAFSLAGVAEEDEEGVFESITLDGHTVVVDRGTAGGKSITDRIEDVRGITVQLDADDSDNTLEFTDSNGDMTVLHFESRIDGES